MNTTGADEAYVRARRLLLDALDALEAHQHAFILVGAQAVYLRTGEVDHSLAPYTTDSDLLIDRRSIARVPPIESLLADHGFMRGENPGIWSRGTDANDRMTTTVDLLVPRAASSAGRRGARLEGHDRNAAGLVDGLSAALIDSDPMRIAALESRDPRITTLRVAGPAALLIAKIHKVTERAESRPDRLSAKDALDIYRILRGIEIQELAVRFRRIRVAGRSDAKLAEEGEFALEQLETLFLRERSIGTNLLLAAIEGSLLDPDEVRESARALASSLCAELAIS